MLKALLTSAPVLIIPERGVGYTVYCDASKEGFGWVLQQLEMAVKGFIMNMQRKLFDLS
jgi:hypothetical protein